VSLDPASYRELVRRALAEDIGQGDLTSTILVDERQEARGTILARAPLVVAGVAVAAEAFAALDPAARFVPEVSDGSACAAGEVVAVVEARARALLTAERTALNFLQRLSGVATLTRRCVDAVAGRVVVLDTRKTTPGLRTLEKYAVRCGGGANHRQRLDDGVLIKDNHKRLAGGVGAATARALAAGLTVPVEVEVETLAELDAALGAGATRILVDNFVTADIALAVARCRGRAAVEVSGGITLARLPEIAATGADFVSIGALTHSAPAVDLSFEIEPR
jgi:nicotinate-nucleotide pyrophosphorylase (carboxylating)